MNTARVIAATLLSLIATSSIAQTERSGSADARVMQQLQQLTGERSALQSENDQLKQEVEQLKKSLQQASVTKASLENRNKALTVSASRDVADGKQTEEQLEHTRGQLQDLVAKFRETAQTLRDVENDRATLKTQLATHEREFKTCVDRNAALVNLNAEVLDKMENRGFWAAVTEREPFLKLKRVELENLADDYRYRAEELKLQQASAAR